jgi:hypothetical protein
MNESPLVPIALVKASAEADDLVRQMSDIKGGRPMVRMFLRLREEAAEAMAEMVKLDTTHDPEKVVRNLQFLQLEARLYRRFIEHCRQIIADGEDADQRVTAEEREQFRDILLAAPGGEETAVRMGLLEDTPYDA